MIDSGRGKATRHSSELQPLEHGVLQLGAELGRDNRIQIAQDAAAIFSLLNCKNFIGVRMLGFGGITMGKGGSVI